MTPQPARWCGRRRRAGEATVVSAAGPRDVLERSAGAAEPDGVEKKRRIGHPKKAPAVPAEGSGARAGTARRGAGAGSRALGGVCRNTSTVVRCEYREAHAPRPRGRTDAPWTAASAAHATRRPAAAGGRRPSGDVAIAR